MILNCTRQEISVITKNGYSHVIKPSGRIPWIEIEKVVVDKIEIEEGVTVPLYQERLVSAKDIPERQDGVYYIVSAKVSEYMPDREDFIMSNLLKDSNGCPIGVTSFRCGKMVEEDYE